MLPQVAAIPFNSVNKCTPPPLTSTPPFHFKSSSPPPRYQLSIHSDAAAGCNLLLIKGAPEKIAALCTHVWQEGRKVACDAQGEPLTQQL